MIKLYSIQMALGIGFIANLIIKDYLGSTVLGVIFIILTIYNFTKEIKD